MIKHMRLSIILVIVMAFVLTSCTSNLDTQIEDLNQEVSTLSQTLSSTNATINELESTNASLLNDLEEANSLAASSVTDLEALAQENESLSMSLEEANESLEALAAPSGGSPTPMAVSPYPGMSVMAAALEVLDALRTNDYAILATYVDPANNLKLAPYQYVDISGTLELTPSQVSTIPTLPTVYPWGNEPGSGNLISLLPVDYFAQYVYDEDYYLAPIVGMNNIVSSGNMINNIPTVFPTADYVEFLFPSFDPSYNGLDWSSITLVFTTDSGMPMLLAIVHGEWTP